jgi:UDP-N-acetylglucosamine/UDP-N-acetylgalactosamine diphosphorylase
MASVVERLIQRGVIIPCPGSVQIGEEIDPERIAPGVILHAGTRLSGANTLISEGSSIGFEAPVTIADCWIGRRVDLRGGYFAKSVFLDDVGFNSGAHVREGTIMEEQSFAGHTVALKQTILFPFVTLGSLINFCDCFMAGGTSRKNHSEVGSAYIHFNFTPNQDKATPSLIGDVPAGVMLREPPIFLGGQGGMVGPCVLSYGTVVAAGSIVRKDETRPNRLIQEGGARSVNVEFTPGLHLSLKRIVLNNARYIANLLALRQWYRHIRSLFVGQQFSEALYTGLCVTLDIAIGERVKRLGEYARNMPHENEASGPQALRQNELLKNAGALPEIVSSLLSDAGACRLLDCLIQSIQQAMDRHGDRYIDTIQGLEPESAEAGKAWLQGLVDSGMHTIIRGLCPSLTEP